MPEYLKYALKRLFAAVMVALLGMSLMYMMPLIKGDPTVRIDLAGYVEHMRKMLGMDFGFSKFYRTEVSPLVWRYLPYTMALCLFSEITAWIVGSLIGLFASAGKSSFASKLVRGAAMAIYPIPYFILAITVQIVFAYMLGWFPVIGEILTGRGFIVFITSLLRSSALPALALILSGLGRWVINTGSVASVQYSEDHVLFARLRGLKRRTVLTKYVMLGCLPLQAAALGVQLGTAFGGSIITEMMYAYPGLGFLMQRAVVNNDYNLLTGASVVSIVAIAFFTFVSDLILPLLDPRITYKS